MNILSLSGFVPEQICDTVRFEQYNGDRNISHYCGYASDYISQVLADNNIDGAVYPKSCDSTRIISSYLKNSGKFLFQINVPSFGALGAEDYFASSIKRYREAVEQHYGTSLEDVKERTEWINNRNKAIKKTYESITDLSYADYLNRIHNILKLPLSKQEWQDDITERQSTDKAVFVVGSFLSNITIIEKIESLGLTVVGDNLPESGRMVSAPVVDTSGDIYKGIAYSILSTRMSPTQNDFNALLDSDFEEIKKKSVKGVIFVMQKYCEPYEYLYSVYKSRLDELGIKSLKLSVIDTEDDRKVNLALEAFSDTL